jgi:hypothetical protein
MATFRDIFGKFLNQKRPSLRKPRPPLAHIPGTMGHAAAVDTTNMEPAMKEALGLTPPKEKK